MTQLGRKGHFVFSLDDISLIMPIVPLEFFVVILPCQKAQALASFSLFSFKLYPSNPLLRRCHFQQQTGSIWRRRSDVASKLLQSHTDTWHHIKIRGTIKWHQCPLFSFSFKSFFSYLLHAKPNFYVCRVAGIVSASPTTTTKQGYVDVSKHCCSLCRKL